MSARNLQRRRSEESDPDMATPEELERLGAVSARRGMHKHHFVDVVPLPGSDPTPTADRYAPVWTDEDEDDQVTDFDPSRLSDAELTEALRQAVDPTARRTLIEERERRA